MLTVWLLFHAGLAFMGMSVVEVGMAVFLGRLDLLVDHMLICGGEMSKMSRIELKAMLRQRLQPVPLAHHNSSKRKC